MKNNFWKGAFVAAVIASFVPIVEAQINNPGMKLVGAFVVNHCMKILNAFQVADAGGFCSTVASVGSAGTYQASNGAGGLQAGNIVATGTTVDTEPVPFLFTGAPFATAVNGQATIGGDAVNGAVFRGQGSTNDAVVEGAGGALRCRWLTGSGNMLCSVPISASFFQPSAASIPLNGMYLPGTNTIGMAANSVEVQSWSQSLITFLAPALYTSTVATPATGQSSFGSSATNGAVTIGFGSVNDWIVENNTGATVCNIPTGQSALTCSGGYIGGGFVPTGGSTAGNRLYLPAVGTVGIAAGSVEAMSWTASLTTIFGNLNAINLATTGTVSKAVCEDALGNIFLSAVNCFAAGSGTLTGVTGTGLAVSSGGSPTPNIAVTAAAKTDQQTPTSNVLAVTPLHQQDHDSAIKAWAVVSSTGTLTAGYNATSVRSALGTYVVSFTVGFASTAFGCNITSEGSFLASFLSKTALNYTYGTYSLAGAFIDEPSTIVCYGRQ